MDRRRRNPECETWGCKRRVSDPIGEPLRDRYCRVCNGTAARERQRQRDNVSRKRRDGLISRAKWT